MYVLHLTCQCKYEIIWSTLGVSIISMLYTLEFIKQYSMLTPAKLSQANNLISAPSELRLTKNKQAHTVTYYVVQEANVMSLSLTPASIELLLHIYFPLNQFKKPITLTTQWVLTKAEQRLRVPFFHGGLARILLQDRLPQPQVACSNRLRRAATTPKVLKKHKLTGIAS